ncbi:FAD-dependent oxidoreductase [bacterium]|nr:FAD-dependent oxidoreductase [bacterium]
MTFDVGIVGAGPIGLATAAELLRRGRSVVIFDKGPIGRTIGWYPRGMRFNSSAGNLALLKMPVPAADGDKPTREEYLAYLRGFVRYFGIEVNTYEEVLRIDGDRGAFTLHTRKKSGINGSYQCRRVVLAVGSNEFARHLGIPGEDLPHVSHYFTDPHTYHGQRVVIVGGRNSAAEAAIRLTHLGAIVTLVHRRAEIDTSHFKYWIGPELIGMISRGRITANLDACVSRIDSQRVYFQRGDGTEGSVDCDFVLLLVGYVPDYRLIDQLGLDTQGEQRAPVFDADTLETTRPGVFCVGTIIAGDQNPYRVFIENALHHPKLVADTLDREMPITSS